MLGSQAWEEPRPQLLFPSPGKPSRPGLRAGGGERGTEMLQSQPPPVTTPTPSLNISKAEPRVPGVGRRIIPIIQ